MFCILYFIGGTVGWVKMALKMCFILTPMEYKGYARLHCRKYKVCATCILVK